MSDPVKWESSCAASFGVLASSDRVRLVLRDVLGEDDTGSAATFDAGDASTSGGTPRFLVGAITALNTETGETVHFIRSEPKP
jgi:hypothetical protein